MKVYDQYKEKLEEAKKQLKAAREMAKEAFSIAAAALFAEEPKLESFGWRQYTPYFNDGDVCTFGVYYDEPDINGERCYDLEEGNEHKLSKQDIERLETKICKLIASFEEADMEYMFNEGLITVYRNGKSKVEDYSHD